MRRCFRTALVAITGTLCMTLIAGSAAAGTNTPVPFPANPSGLRSPGPVGSSLDIRTPYQPQASCAAEPMPGTVKLRDLVLQTYGRGYDGGAIRSCVTGSTSEHKEGRAWDWMLDLSKAGDRRAAGDFLAWATEHNGAMARRLGIMYVIYNKRMWSMWSGGWETYSGSDPHTNHVHVSLGWNGARGHTSFWTGRTWALDYGTCQYFRLSPATAAGSETRTTPCLAPVEPARALGRALLWMGSAGDDVRAAQRLLGSPVTGTFGTVTRSRVLRYQRHHDLPRTGAVDRATWAALLPRSARSLHPEWTAAQARTWLREVADSPTLRRGSAGRAVTALQATLGVSVQRRTGFYGRRTSRLVNEALRAHHSGQSRVARVVRRVLV